MDMLQRIDCELNDSDVHEVIEDGFSHASNDFVYELSYESVGTISSSTTSASIESNSPLMTFGHSGVSLLIVLKSSNSSDYLSQRKIAKNLPVGKKRQSQILKAIQKPLPYSIKL